MTGAHAGRSPLSRRSRAARAPLPLAVVVLGLAGAALIILPLAGMGTRVAWGWLPELLSSSSARAALGLSLRTSLASTAVCVALGVPLALLLWGENRWLCLGRDLTRPLALAQTALCGLAALQTMALFAAR